MGLRIRLLGKPAIVDEADQPQIVRGLQTWAVLARILLTRRPLSRRQIAAEIFPDAVDPLGSLRWCLAALRRAIGSAEALNGDPVEAKLPAGTLVDVVALADGTLDVAAAGDLLDGVEARSSPEFATWLLVERERAAGRVAALIRQEVLQAISAGAYERAIGMAERGVRRAPFDEDAHILLVKSLALAGREAAALAHVEATTQRFADELGEPPTPALRSAARRTVASPPAGLPAQAVARSLIDSGLAAVAAGAADAGIDCLRRAAAEAERSRDRQLHARALLELGTALVHAVRGYDQEGAVILRQAVEQARESDDPRIAAAGLRELGYVDALAGRRPEAARHVAEALHLADGDESRAGINGVSAFNLVDWGRIADGLEQFELSLEQARRSGQRRREAWSLGLGGWGQLAADQPEKACRWATACLAIVDDLRWLAFRPWPLAVLAEARLRLQADPAVLRCDLQEAFAMSCQLADPCWEAATARGLALTHAARGDLQAALHWLTEARTRCVRETDVYAALRVVALADSAGLSARAGRAEEADAMARELLALAARAHMDHYVERAMMLIGGRAG